MKPVSAERLHAAAAAALKELNASGICNPECKDGEQYDLQCPEPVCEFLSIIALQFVFCPLAACVTCVLSRIMRHAMYFE